MEDFIAYHGLSGRRPPGFTFSGMNIHPEGIHLGTLAQARMRAGTGTVLKVRILASKVRRIPRVRDRDGYWKDYLRRRARQGDRILAYLNRYEGIPVNRVIETRHADLSCKALNDASFRKLVPEATDSWIVLDPDLVEILGTVRRTKPKALAA